MRSKLTLALGASMLALTLAACHPTAQDSSGGSVGAVTTDSPAEPVEPASAPTPVQAVNADFSAPLQAAGTEPFWGLSIRPDGLILTRPDHAAVRAANPGPAYDGKTAVWTAPELTATLTPTHCSDGMSEREYPYAAVVVVAGVTLKGCARPVR